MGEEMAWTGSFNLSTSSRANADLMVRLQGSAVRELTVFWHQVFDSATAPDLGTERPEVRRRIPRKNTVLGPKYGPGEFVARTAAGAAQSSGGQADAEAIENAEAFEEFQ